MKLKRITPAGLRVGHVIYRMATGTTKPILVGTIARRTAPPHRQDIGSDHVEFDPGAGELAAKTRCYCRRIARVPGLWRDAGAPINAEI